MKKNLRMTTSVPENFLTRYNTTDNSCECLDKHWSDFNYPGFPEYQCKHIKVFKDPSAWRSWMMPLIPIQRCTPPPGWLRCYTYRQAQELGYSREDILEYISKVNMTELNPFHRVTHGELNQYHRFRINFYKTTKDSCDCPFLKFHPDVPFCKHIRYFREYHKCDKSSVLSTTNTLLVNDIEEFNRQKEIFEKERDEYAEKLDLCHICYTGKNIHVCSTCTKNGICIDCYKEMESKKKYGSTKCPYCRTPLPNIVDYLVEKFKNFNK